MIYQWDRNVIICVSGLENAGRVIFQNADQ